MNIQILIILTLSYLTTLAQESELNVLDDYNRIINSALTSPENSCVVNEQFKDPLCEDLFEASCLKNGKNAHKESLKELQVEAEKKIDMARDLSAQELGFKNFDAALKDRLNKAGLTILNDVDPITFSNLKKTKSTSQEKNSPHLVFSSVQECVHELDTLNSVEVNMTYSIEDINKTLKEYEAFLYKYDKLRIKFYAQDLTYFMSDNIEDTCQALEKYSAYYPEEDNLKAGIICKQKEEIKREAVDLFRKQDDISYETDAEKFISKYLLPLPSNGTSYYSEATDSGKVLIKIDKLRKQLNLYCESLGELAQNNAGLVFDQLALEVNLSKTTVDSLVDSFYGEDKKKTIKSMIQFSRQEIQTLVSQFVTDSAKKEQILREYENIDLKWLEKPDPASYKKNKNGLLTLDEEKVKILASKTNKNYTLTPFDDSELSFFSEFNANYMPQFTYGIQHEAERIQILPTMIENLTSNPDALLVVLAHELGHKIGPGISYLNGYDLSDEYKSLIDCFKSSESIKLVRGQEDEVIADYIAAETLASLVSKLPQEERRKKITNSMSVFCISESEQTHLSCKNSHPNPVFRIGGIFGGNPNLRKAMGCSVESSKYKSCGLSNLSLKEAL